MSESGLVREWVSERVGERECESERVGERECESG